jgi:hypothetical protein
LQAAAQIDAGDRNLAQVLGAQANQSFHTIATNVSATPAMRKTASARMKLLVRTFPALAQQTFHIQTAYRPPLNVNVLTSWTSPGDDTYRLLHIRVNLTANSAVSFNGASFRIKVDSPEAGTESVYGLTRQAPNYTRTDWGSTTANAYVVKPDVDPVEDLGYHGVVQMHVGDSVTYVITFLVRGDADMDAAAHSLQYVSQ